jgi:hypothetical protein
VILLPGAFALAGPARIVLRPIDLDIDMLRYLKVEPANTATERLRNGRDPGIRQSKTHDCFAMRAIEPVDQGSPAAGTRGNPSEDGIHTLLRPSFGVENGRAAGHRDLAVSRAENAHKRIVDGDAEAVRPEAVAGQIRPLNSHGVGLGESDAAVERTSQPTSPCGNHDVERVTARDRQAVGLQRRDPGQPAAEANGTDRYFWGVGHGVPAVPHPKDAVRCEFRADLPVENAQRPQVAASRKTTAGADDLGDGFNGAGGNHVSSVLDLRAP